MKSYEEQKGISFLIVYFSKYDEYYYLPFEKLYIYWCEAKDGGRKSIPYDVFEDKYKLVTKNGMLLHYLEGIQVDLEYRGN